MGQACPLMTWTSILPSFWTINRHLRFDSEFKQVIKDRNKSDKGSGEAFAADVQRSIKQLRVNPRAVDHAETEPYPNGYAVPGLELWKIYYRVRRRGGASSYIRLIYEINEDTRCVWLLTIYTHKRYAKRLDDKELGRRLRNSRLEPEGA